MTDAVTTEIAIEMAHAADIPTAQAKEALREKELKRRIASFQFFKVLPEWRRLPAEECAAHNRTMAAMLDRVG